LFVVEVTHLRKEDMQTVRLKMLAKVQKAQQGVKLAQTEEKDKPADESQIIFNLVQMSSSRPTKKPTRLCFIIGMNNI